jgi:polyhydroxyalkanoate synthesis regulator phasin
MKTETVKNKHIDDLHFEHELWTSEAKFYADELKIYQKRLEEVASKNNSPEVLKQVEHFQNKFIIQKEQLDILNHEVTVHEQWLAKFAKKNPIAVDHQLFGDHKTMHDRMDSFHTIYAGLKNEFKRFLATWM